MWAVIFSFFAVPREYQFRVLFWGIFGALVLRAIFIFAGVSLIERFEWVLYIFGAFLLYTAVKIAHHDETKQVDYNKNIAMRLVRRFVPTTDEYDGQKLFTRRNAKRLATPLFAVLDPDRGHRRRVRRRLRPGGPGRQPRAVHRVRRPTRSPSSACARCTSCSAGCRASSAT